MDGTLPPINVRSAIFGRKMPLRAALKKFCQYKYVVSVLKRDMSKQTVESNTS
jgi:hypothetical protein